MAKFNRYKLAKHLVFEYKFINFVNKYHFDFHIYTPINYNKHAPSKLITLNMNNKTSTTKKLLIKETKKKNNLSSLTHTTSQSNQNTSSMHDASPMKHGHWKHNSD